MGKDLQNRQTAFFTHALQSRAMGDPGDPGKPGDPIRFVASTAMQARDKMVIEPTAWQLDHFRANPVVLWVHDYRSVPIGRATPFINGTELVADVIFDQEDEFARKVESKYRRGYLSAVSVGWDTKEVIAPTGGNDPLRVTKAELLDISCVPVPSDPYALAQRQAQGLAMLGQQFTGLSSALADTLNFDNDGEGAGDSEGESVHDEAPWDETAVAMMRLFYPGLPMSERERRRAYNRLCARYRRAGKTAPEWVAASDLEKLGLPELRGLFLESEPGIFPMLFAEERAGAVLSARNRGDLSEAIRLIQGVIDRAETPKKEEKGEQGDQGEQPDPKITTETEEGMRVTNLGSDMLRIKVPVATVVPFTQSVSAPQADLAVLQAIRDSLSAIKV